jgi:Meiotically Up-regulated Gene 113 (MUG113) protein
MKVGREKRYKIGKADIVERRTRQIAVQLPEGLELVHPISSDDACGIDASWHRRFAENRRGGDWFELTAAAELTPPAEQRVLAQRSVVDERRARPYRLRSTD